MGKPSNIIEVATLAGVSSMTVSRYFNQPEKLAEATREKVQAAVEQLSYVPNAAALTLLRGRSETLALVFQFIDNPFFAQVIRGAEDAAFERGYTMFVADTTGSVEKETKYLKSLIRRRVDGVLMSPTHDEASVTSLAKHNVPVVLVDHTIEGSLFDSVRGDSMQAGRLLTQHLIDKNCPNITFIGGLPERQSLQERLAGYTETMKKAGLEPKAHLGRYDEASGFEITERLYKDGSGPETLIAASNQVAIGIIKALQKANIWQQDKVKLASFDNVDASFFEIYQPFTAVVAQPAYEIGKQASDILIDRIEGLISPPREVVLPVELIT